MAGMRGIAMLVVIGSIIVMNMGVGTSGQCEDRIPALIRKCYEYVKKEGPMIPPSKGCCEVVHGADIPCLCSFLTPIIKSLISMDKVVYVAKCCGSTVPPGTHCGSYVVPLKA